METINANYALVKHINISENIIWAQKRLGGYTPQCKLCILINSRELFFFFL